MCTQALTFLGSGSRWLDAPRIRGAETTQDFKPESPRGGYVVDHGEGTVFLVSRSFTFTSNRNDNLHPSCANANSISFSSTQQICVVEVVIVPRS